MTSLSTEHTLIAAIPILVVLAVLSAAIIVLPKVNLDDSSRAQTEVRPLIEVGPLPSPHPLPTTSEFYVFPSTSE